jgi:hypothetical protein
MSRFNTQMICKDCETEEKQHKDYIHAVVEELRQINENNNYNFEGIGLPSDLEQKSQIRKENNIMKRIVDLSADC